MKVLIHKNDIGMVVNKFKLLLLIGLIFIVSGTANAVTIIKFDLVNPVVGPDIEYVNGVLSTVLDGNPATAGNQESSIQYLGFLDSLLADINLGASLSLNGVTAVGVPTVLGLVISQITTGGTFDIYSPTNTLLLSGVLGGGAITGSSTSSSGSFFNTNTASFTGGSLLSLVAPSPSGFSISFTNILTAGSTGMRVGLNGLLSNFTADATGQVEGTSAVPEPATIALLLSGVLGGVARRRKVIPHTSN